MKIEKDSRQVPSSSCYTADKKYNDLLWGYLQAASYREKEQRYIDKLEVNFKKMADYFGVTRQTIAKQFRGLEELELITYEEEMERQRFSLLEPELASLLPTDTLRKLNNTLQQNCISIYVYLLKGWFQHNENNFCVTLPQIKRHIGIDYKTGSNNFIITDIFEVLKKLGLIDYELRWEGKNKCIYWITDLKNTI